MKLAVLRVDRLPGLPQPFSLRPGPGVTLLLGPNASGKSSVARAVAGLLWPQDADGAGQLLTAEFTDAEGALTAERSGGAAVTWHRDGVPAPAPVVPAGHLARCYRLGAQDLLGAGRADLEHALAADLRTAMAGGVDLDAVAADVGAPSRPRYHQLARAWDAAEAAAHEVGLAQADLARRRDGLTELEERLAAAEAAERETRLLAAVQDLRRARRELAEAEAARASLPVAVARARPEDVDDFVDLQERAAARAARARELAGRLGDDEEALARIAPPDAEDPDDVLPRLEARVRAVHEAARAAAAADAALAGADEAWRQARAGLAGPDAVPDADDLPDDEAFADLAARHHHARRAEARREVLDALSRDMAPAFRARRAGPLACLVVGLLLVVAPVAAPDLPPSLTYALAAAGLVALVLGFGLAVQVARRRLADALAARRDEAADEPPPPDARWTLGRRLDETGWVRDLDKLREAARRRGDRDAARARARTAAARLDEALASCAALLAPWGDEPPADAADAEEALTVLRARRERRDRLRAQVTDLRAELDTARRDAADLDARRAALLDRLGLPPDTVEPGPLRSLVDAIPARVRADEALGAARQKVALCEEAAADAGDLETLDDDALATRRAEAEARAATEKELRDERAALRHAVETARRGHDRAAALADADRARDRLAEWRDDARGQALEAALLDEVREQHESDVTPAQLERARALFAAFTAGRYRLLLAPARAGGAFGARDRARGRALDLDQLSDGTRAQLLLAVRLAFLEHAETGARPPLLLDETLATADPERRDAVAGSLGLLARDTGRQVLYLTSDPGDAAAWNAALAARGLPEPAVLDLAAERGLAAAARPEELDVPAAPAVPAAAGHDAASYGRALGVERLDPHRPWEEVDTFHLAAPDLDRVRRLRLRGLTRAGLLDAAMRETPQLLEPADAAVLARALRVLRAFVEAWRVGRPRPALPADVLGSGALSDVMGPRVLKVLEDVRGDATALVAALRDGAVPRLRTDAIDALAEHLEGAGCLDRRGPLDDDAVLARVQAQVAQGVAGHDEAHPPEEVRMLVHRLLRAVPRSLAAAPSSRRSSG